jgi:hypothetical protein
MVLPLDPTIPITELHLICYVFPKILSIKHTQQGSRKGGEFMERNTKQAINLYGGIFTITKFHVPSAKYRVKIFLWFPEKMSVTKITSWNTKGI